MYKKNLLRLLAIMMVATLNVSLAACGSDEDEDNGLVDTPSISVQDPEGTVTISMGGGSFYDIGLEAKIHIDGNNNFVTETVSKQEWHSSGYGISNPIDYDYFVEFASVGKVNGLGQVTSIPVSGWSKSIVVIPGTGYIARIMRKDKTNNSDACFYGKYTRLYVEEQNTGATVIVKYQTPFEVPFELEKTSVALSHYWAYYSSYTGSGTYLTGTSERFEIINGTSDIKVAEKPSWCSVTITNEGKTYITITAEKNPDPQPRSGKVVLKNSVCSATITVTQDVAPAE